MKDILLESILDNPNLRSAWDKVRENGGCAGTDGQTLADFGSNLQVNLWALNREVTSGTYLPQALLSVTLQKPGKKPRMLAIPSVRDRVLQTAVARYLQPILEHEFEECSFGYRPGRSVDMAVRRIMSYRDQGFQWVVDADITHYFDEIDHSMLLLELSRHVDDAGVLKLIRIWLRTPIQNEHAIWTPIRGVPQGSPISPLLANLYLDWFDEQLLAKGQRLVRFADDFLILCKSRETAEDALDITDDLLNALALQLNTEKTKLTHFDEGFRFLGVLFLRSLVMKSRIQDEPVRICSETTVARPTESENAKTKVDEDRESRFFQVLPESGKAPDVDASVLTENNFIESDQVSATDEASSASDPILRTLYVNENGARLSKDGETICIHCDGELIRRIPVRKLDQIILFGNIQLTTPFMTGCLQRGISITLLSKNGGFYGIIDTLDSRNTELQRDQFACADSADNRLRLARAFVLGKLRNSRVILSRYARKRHLSAFDKAVAEHGRLIASLDNARKLNAVRGFEGMAANHYFQAWRAILETEWDFTGRKRQPPPDPVNVLLSFGYTLLFNNVFSLLRARGLNTHVGFLHAERAGHPALASDIMEEFRAPIIDATVLSLVLNGRLSRDDFKSDATSGGCHMSDQARKTFIHAFEKKMNSRLIHPATGRKIDYRRCVDQQVHLLAKSICDSEIPYRPFVVR